MSQEAPEFHDNELKDDVDLSHSSEAAQRLVSDAEHVPGSPFQVPPSAQRELDARTSEYDSEFDRLDRMGIYNHLQIQQMLEKKGLYSPPYPNGKIEQETHYLEIPRGTPSRKVNPKQPNARTHPALSPAVRKRPGYDKRPDK